MKKDVREGFELLWRQLEMVKKHLAETYEWNQTLYDRVRVLEDCVRLLDGSSVKQQESVRQKEQNR